MAITPVTANPPAENVNPWYSARTTLDNQLKATANAAAELADAHETQKGTAGGIATLGSDSKLLASQLPAIAIQDFLGTVATQAAMLALVGEKGDWTIRTDRGTVFIITGANPAVIGGWTEMAYPTAPVTSVAGRTGVVVLSTSDIASGTFADARIPALAISKTNGLQAALDAKVDDSEVADVVGKVGWVRGVTIANGGSTAGIAAGTWVMEEAAV